MSSISDDLSSCDKSSMSSSCAGKDSGNSSSRSGRSNRTGESTEDDLQTIKDALAKHETKQVFRLRVVVVLILIAAATGISLTVYFLTKNAEEEEFEVQYYGLADKIIEHFQDMMQKMSAVSGLAVAATAHSESMEEMWAQKWGALELDIPVAWPFVTLPNFQERGGNVRSLSGAIYVSINPIVTTEQLPYWESFVQGEANKWM